MSASSKHLALFALGDPAASENVAKRIMERIGLCAEFSGIVSISRQTFKEDSLMAIDPTVITQLINLIDDVIEKSRRDALKDQVADFGGHYLFVVRHGFHNGGTEKCRAKEKEVHAHWQKALTAARAGNADDLQNAIAAAMDDLRELAECLGIDPVPF